MSLKWIGDPFATCEIFLLFISEILTLKLRLSFLFTCEALYVLPALERTMSLLLLTTEFVLKIDERKLKLEIGVPSAWDLILLGYRSSILHDLKKYNTSVVKENHEFVKYLQNTIYCFL